MAARIIDGRAIAAELRGELRVRVHALREEGVDPCLATVLVGEDPHDARYIDMKHRACREAGMASRDLRFSRETDYEELLEQIERLNAREEVHGIFVQLPVPAAFGLSRLSASLAPSKDVDGLHPLNRGLLLDGRDGFYPCTPIAAIRVLERSGVALTGMHVVVCDRKGEIGRPLVAALMQEGSPGRPTVTLCRETSRKLGEHTLRADLIVAAGGPPEWLTGDMVGNGAVVVDAGLHRVKDGTLAKGYRLAGDVHMESVMQRASQVVPAPGGLGPVTIALLLENTVRAARTSLHG